MYESVCYTCDRSVHQDAASIGFVFVCRKLTPHFGV